MRFLSKFFALLLTFILGFVTCIGTIVGAGYYAYAHLSFGQLGLNMEGVTNEDEASVVITDLTLKDLIEEINTVSEIAQTLTLDDIVQRYGLIIPEDVDFAIPDELRTVPLSEVFAKEGIKSVLQNVYLGHLFGYNSVEYNEGGSVRYAWYYPDTNEAVSGINNEIASHTLYEFLGGKFSVDSLLNELTVGDVLEMKAVSDLPVYVFSNPDSPVTDAPPITVWYGKDGTRASAVLSAMAPFYIDEIEDKLDGLTISEFMNYVTYQDETYSVSVETKNGLDRVILTPATGIVAEIEDLTLSQLASDGLDEKIKEVYVSTALGLAYNELDGEWYNGTEKVSGVVAVFAKNGYKVGELNGKIDQMKLGEIANLSEIDGVWYESVDKDNPENNVVADGVLGALANVSIKDVNDENTLVSYVKTVKVADALGYEKIDGVWYSEYEDAENNVKASGIMAVIADTEIEHIQEKVDGTLMGELLGYTKDGESGIWKDSEGNAVHVLMNSVCNRTFSNIDGLCDSLTVSQVIPSDKRTGLVSLIDESTPLDDVADELDGVLNTKTIGSLVEANIIKFKNPDGTANEEKKAAFLASSYSSKTIPELLDSLVLESNP